MIEKIVGAALRRDWDPESRDKPAPTRERAMQLLEYAVRTAGTEACHHAKSELSEFRVFCVLADVSSLGNVVIIPDSTSRAAD